jgi:hypothetical protein
VTRSRIGFALHRAWMRRTRPISDDGSFLWFRGAFCLQIVEFLENREAWFPVDKVGIAPFRGSKDKHVVVDSEPRSYVLLVLVGGMSRGLLNLRTE